MAKMSLLDMVQDILSDLDADEVNSVDDTVEATQVAQIIKTCYFEMISNRNWPHLKKVIQLDASNELSRPNYLKMPERLKELSSFKYRSTSDSDSVVTYNDVKYLHPDEFLRLVSSRSVSNVNTSEIEDVSGVKLYIYNNKAPSYWTSFDDVYLITDSYDQAVEATLQKQNTQCLAYMEPLWERSDDYVPDLPSEAFSALLEEAKSTAFIVLKQMANQKSEQKAGRQQRWLARKAWRAHGGVRYSDFGRKSRK